MQIIRIYISFEVVISPSKEYALLLAIVTNHSIPIRVYSNSSRFGGIGASAILYIKDQLTKLLHCYLSTEYEHTMYSGSKNCPNVCSFLRDQYSMKC
jgi:hypothetical protein